MTITARSLAIIFCLFAMTPVVMADQSPTDVTFPSSDGGTVDADLYGSGTHAVVFAHGAIFNKQSWATQAKLIAAHGMQALAIDFRSYGKSRAGSQRGALDLDVIAAVRWLHKQGAKQVDVVGGSMGGGAAARAATEVEPGELNKLLLLSPMPIKHPENMKAASILYIASRDEGLVPTLQQQYKLAPEPKQLILLDGDSHAQNIFTTDQAENLNNAIVNFLVTDK